MHLQGFLNANQQNPAKGMLNSSTAAAGFVRPYSNWGVSNGSYMVGGDITAAVNEFYSHFNSLLVRLEMRSVRDLTLLNSFTWEHSLDNASASLEGNTPSPQNAYNLRADYGQSDYNQPLANVTSLVWEVPVGRGHALLSNPGKYTQTLLGGWQISGINTLQAGTPFNVTYTPNSLNSVSPQISASYRGANLYRPNVVAGKNVALCNSGHSCLSHRNSTNGTINYINPSAFSLPATYNTDGTLASPFGNASRNPGRTPSFWQTDLDLNKKFNTPSERIKVEFRAELYNIFNRTNLYLPSSALGSATGTSAAGTPSSGTGYVSGTFEPRIVQFGLKVTY